MGVFVTSSVIVHDLPVAPSGPQLILSDALSACPPEVLRRFDERINHSLARAGTNVEFIGPSGIVRTAVAKMLSDASNEKTVVRASRKIAQRLAEVQTGRNSPGILVISVGTRNQKSSVAVMKLEREAGVQLTQDSREDGKLFFDLAHLNDLMLTNKTRTLKVAEFLDPDASPCGTACDDQMGSEFARFFLRDFLDCKLCLDPPVASELFFSCSQEFFDEHVSSGEQKVDYQSAIVVELLSRRDQIDPRKFASDHLEPAHQDPYLKHLKERGVPTKRFPKDTTRVQSRLRSRRLRFENGVVASIPFGLDENGCLVEDLDDGRTRVVIEDRLDSVRGGR